ncbi:CocE/NonD family hydrolase [Aquihabitans daechungensis]|uniref:CocE/NonD family hydrolase n=1 Tax=Aquihabitans daechungensis TaxID=1052257 RepID=UPI003B9FE12C
MVLALVAAGCSSDGSDGGGPEGSAVEIDAHGGTGQVWLTSEPGVELELQDADGKVVPTQVVDEDAEVEMVDRRTTDEAGALVLRYVPVGEDYVVRQVGGSGESEPVDVTGVDDHPKQEFYDEQEIGDGYGYLTTRDGTKLAINVTLPGPIEDGPYPTVIEYSGYDPANPEPSLVTISKTLAGGQGFATVGVNIRGSGCSGGSFQLWEDPQAIDGYDVVETIAAQPWVKGNQVGMVGISYPASAMLYTAATNPPHLAAIAPMAAYDDGFRALLWPGGIQNKGFARSWVEERDKNAKPLEEEWTKKRVEGGDETCEENMALRGQNVPVSEMIDARPYYPTENDLGDSFAPETFVDEIDVPTFLVASWQDEQVGGHAATMVPALENVPHKYVTLLNGMHTEGLANPTVLQRWMEFLQLYVAEETPDTSGMAGLYAAVAGQIIGDNAAAGTLPVPPEHFSKDTSYEDALAEYEDQAPVRVLFDEGGDPDLQPGVPSAGFEQSFSEYPLAETEATTWYLGPDGTLTETEPTGAEGDDTTDSYTSDPKARPEVNLVKGEDSWWRLPEHDWQSPSPEHALSYVTPALAEDTTMVGSGSADLWIKSSEQDTDLQVTLTEVRPDGKETYVQSGWLRASKREVDDERSTELQPLLTQLEDDAAPLPADEFTPVRVEIYPFAHAFRAGSKIRVIISAPGGDKPVWSFVNLDGTQENEVARSSELPSAVVLPVIPGVEITTPLPACPALRGQPCREYQPEGS